VQNPTADLPGADEEVAAIATEYTRDGCPRPDVMKHANATKIALTEALASAAKRDANYVLHLACHGQHSTRWGSGVVLAGGDQFTVADAITAPLERCRLCVASACSTALNDSIADPAAENIGLPSALLVAGVSAVVAGLWRVDDAATALLMTRLHFELGKGKTVSAALSGARTWLRGLRTAEVGTRLRSISGDLCRRWVQRGGLGEGSGTFQWNRDLVQADDAATAADRMRDMVGSTVDDCGASRGPGDGIKFSGDDWSAFVEAHREGRVEAVATHLFPTKAPGSELRMPERDFWFRCKDLVAGQPWTWVILHVHYLGAWEELDETGIAQVNARFANANVPMFYEAHPEIQCGILPTNYMFRVTARQTDPKKGKDPTKWMGGGPNQPPPWQWRSDPDRGHVGPFDLTAPGHVKAKPFVYTAEERRRFREAHDVMAFGLKALADAPVARIGPGVLVAGQTKQELVGGDPAGRPFASPVYWAGFVITGWGCVPVVQRSSIQPDGAAAVAAPP